VCDERICESIRSQIRPRTVIDFKSKRRIDCGAHEHDVLRPQHFDW